MDPLKDLLRGFEKLTKDPAIRFFRLSTEKLRLKKHLISQCSIINVTQFCLF